MFRIFGPPGTGKTTTLLNMVEKAMESGIPPQRVGFFAFTVKAATEAKERAVARFNLDPDVDLPHFRTIHSLAYRQLGMRDHQMMSTENWQEFGSKILINSNIDLKPTQMDEENSVSFRASDHLIMRLINLSRAKKTTLKKVCSEYPGYIPYNTYEINYVADSYRNYKEAYGVLDFSDLLDEFAAEADLLLPEFDICFVDEAQDLSSVQWDIVHALDKKSKRLYVAGDDDQAIYTWAGADVDQFVSVIGDAEVLEQSYRVPRSVHAVAERIANRITNRFPKRYLPKPEEGKVDSVRNVTDLDMSEGKWLILAQANYMLREVAEELKSRGYLFQKPDGYRSIPEKMSRAILGWEQLRKGQQVSYDVAKIIYSYMSGNNVRIKRGHKKIIAEEDQLFSLRDLQEHYGLLADDSMIWCDAMDRIPPGDREYIRALLKKGEKFSATPKIKLSTIHGSKGGESQNVVVLTDLTTAALSQNNDELHRMYYVAVTRASESLYIVQPKDYDKAYTLLC